MLKDEQDCSYNGGGDARPLRSWSDFSTLQYTERILVCFVPPIFNSPPPLYPRVVGQSWILRARLEFSGWWSDARKSPTANLSHF